MRISLFLCLCFGLPLSVLDANLALAADLRVQVNSVQSRHGVMRFALYNRASGFPTHEGRFAYLDVPVPETGSVVAVFTDLAPGAYAVAAYHDENGNGEFDQGFLGLPLEGYGFSRDASGFLSAPSFSSAAVLLEEGGKTIRIRLSY